MTYKSLNFANQLQKKQAMLKKISITLVMMLTALSIFAETRQHLIKPGETLYSLSKLYNVTVEAILEINPSVEGTNIKAGMMLNIPDPITPAAEVKKTVVENNAEEVKNTEKGKKGIFSIFGKKDKKDKKNKKQADEPTTIVTTPSVVKSEEKTEQEAYQPVGPVKRVKAYGAPDNIVVILPFKLDSKNAAEDKLQMRSVEFYEGLLLAVDEAQKAGQRILIQTYDLGTKSMSEILATQSLKDADMIIAPMDAKDVEEVAEFGKANDINVVSAFAFNQELSKDNPNLIQLNTSKALLYDNLTKEVLTRFKYNEIVFLTDSNAVSKTDPYAELLKKEMASHSVKYHEFTYKNPEKLATIERVLRIPDGSNILYIPTFNSKDALRKMFPSLKCTAFEEVDGEMIPRTSNSKISILGYPEWVLYTSDFMNDYYDMNVHMFSKFYVNPFDERVKTFYRKFHYWFDKDPMPLTPRYALLGYDIGTYFLAAIRKYGMNFNEHLGEFSKETLQSMMSFERDGQGWLNKGLYLVNFQPSTQIEKYEIK